MCVCVKEPVRGTQRDDAINGGYNSRILWRFLESGNVKEESKSSKNEGGLESVRVCVSVCVFPLWGIWKVQQICDKDEEITMTRDGTRTLLKRQTTQPRG